MASYSRVWGHRGCRGTGNPPENSLEAFQSAMRQGASGIELDVFLSSDNHLVVFHDETLERMSDGNGPVSSLTLSELKQLRLRNAYGDLTEQEIPTLDEVFTLLDGCRSLQTESPSDLQRAEQFVLNIEIKGLGIATRVERAIEAHLGTNWKYHNILVSSFDMGSLEELRTLNPKIPVAVLFAGPIADPREPWDLQPDELEQCLAISGNLHPQAVNITLPSLTSDAVKVIRAIGAIPVAWTWNETPPDALSDQTRGAIAEHIRRNDITVITDYPRKMIELLTSYT